MSKIRELVRELPCNCGEEQRAAAFEEERSQVVFVHQVLSDGA